MDNANKFFDNLGNQFKNEINVSVIGKVINVNDDTVDVQPFAHLPLLVGLDTVKFAVEDYLIKQEFQQGDTVVVVFTDYSETGSKDNSLSNGVVIGATTGRETITLKDYINKISEVE